MGAEQFAARPELARSSFGKHDTANPLGIAERGGSLHSQVVGVAKVNLGKTLVPPETSGGRGPRDNA